jgi:hypothetical protein
LLPEQLDGHLAAEDGIGGEVGLSETALPEEARQLVTVDQEGRQR